MLSGNVGQGWTTLDLTDGKWIIFAYCTVLVNGAEKALEIYKNNTSIKATFFGNNSGSIWSNLCVCDVVEKASNDTIKLKAEISSNPSSRSCWIAIKLGTATVVD